MKYPPELREKAIEMLRQGKGIAEVARELGVPYYTVKEWARSAGIVLARIRRYPQELKEKAVEMLRQGKGIAEVARELGVPYYAVRAWAHRAGIRLASAKRYPPEVKEKALELVKQGLPYSEVARQLGLSINTVQNWAYAAGIKRMEARRHPPEVREKAVEMLKQGVPATEVARQLGVSYATVLNWAYAAGLQPGGARSARQYPPEIREKAVRLVKAGFSYDEAGALLGVSGSAVREWCIKAGVRSIYSMRPALTERRALSPEERRAAILRVVADFEREKGFEGLTKCAEEALERSMHLASGRAPLTVAGTLIHLCSKLLGKVVSIPEAALFLAKYPGLGKTPQGVRNAVKAWLAHDPVFKKLQEKQEEQQEAKQQERSQEGEGQK
jgi:transposase-like protein